MVQEDAQALQHILLIAADVCQTLFQQLESVDVKFQIGEAQRRSCCWLQHTKTQHFNVNCKTHHTVKCDPKINVQFS